MVSHRPATDTLAGMADLIRIQAVWQGFQGAPGYTNLYFIRTGGLQSDADAAGTRTRAFFEAIKALMNVEYTVKVQRLVQGLDSASGNMFAEFDQTTDPAITTPTGTGAYSTPTGVVVNWLTGQFNSLGHRVIGRTFLVPMNGGCFQNDGSVLDSALTTITTAALALGVGTPNLGVWTRPSTPSATDGVARPVTGVRVPDKAAVLKSRRD